jgi:hypothetical protein
MDWLRTRMTIKEEKDGVASVPTWSMWTTLMEQWEYFLDMNDRDW